jgi:hypothetical protein
MEPFSETFQGKKRNLYIRYRNLIYLQRPGLQVRKRAYGDGPGRETGKQDMQRNFYLGIEVSNRINLCGNILAQECPDRKRKQV